MKHILIIALSLLFIATSAFAATTVATVHVNGLVCDFCARAVEKTFGKQDAVSTVKVDLDKKIVVLEFKDQKNIDDTAITKLITDAGYNVVSIDRGGE
jgi:copper chaperone CopZ